LPLFAPDFWERRFTKKNSFGFAPQTLSKSPNFPALSQTQKTRKAGFPENAKNAFWSSLHKRETRNVISGSKSLFWASKKKHVFFKKNTFFFSVGEVGKN